MGEVVVSVRVVLVFAHLLLCVFALQLVLTSDFRVLTRHVSPRRMLRVHRKLVWLLGGLWLSGLAVVFLDLGPDLAGLSDKTKLVTKLLCVSVLTLNGLVLRHVSFPRLTSGRRLGDLEATLVMATGAISLTSWLMAAFIGIARPLQTWTLPHSVALYLGALGVGVVVAALLAPRLNSHREAQVDTAIEEAAQNLDLRSE